MQITSKGQVTIPKKYRDVLGLLPYTHIEFERIGDELRVRKAKDNPESSRGSQLIAAMAGKGDIAMSTDDIMALTRET